MTLLEFYRERRHEVELLANGKVLFLLSFIAELNQTDIGALARHLSWRRKEIERLLQQLADAGMVRLRVSPSSIRISPRGRQFLQFLRLQDAPPQSESGLGWARRPRRVSAPPFTSAFPMGPGEERREYEQRLMSLAREARDKDAFGALVRELWQYVYGRCFLVLNNEADAEDAALDTFFKAYDDLQKISPDPSKSVRTWLSHLAHEESVGFLRVRKKESFAQPLPDTSGEIPEEDAEAFAPEELDLDHSMMVREHHQVILGELIYEKPLQPLQVAFREAWDRLSEMDRLILGMRYWDELPTQAIAERLGISAAAVSNRIHKARMKLKLYMGE